MGYGVIGNTADSGSAILGSSPGTPAKSVRRKRLGGPFGLGYADNPDVFWPPSSSGLGRRPLTAVAWVRIPSGVQNLTDGPGFGRGFASVGSDREWEFDDATRRRRVVHVPPGCRSHPSSRGQAPRTRLVSRRPARSNRPAASPATPACGGPRTGCVV